MFAYLVLAIVISLGIFSTAIIIFNETFLFFYLYIEYHVGTIQKPNDYPPIKLQRYLINYFLELYYLLSSYYLLPLKWKDFSIVKNRNSKTAILFVHGYCRNQIDWRWMRKQFASLDNPIFCVNLEPNFAGIDEITLNSLPREIDFITKYMGCDKIILIGHSMGGLVSSYYNEFLDIHNRTAAVITIGSPLHGTKVSVSAKGDNAKQMCPQSMFLESLVTRMNTNPNKYYQIITKFDNIVFPWQSALLANTQPQQQYILEHTGHLGLLYSRAVAKQLNKWISEIQEAT